MSANMRAGMRIVVLGDEDTVTGFRMAGVEGHVCDAAAARAKARELGDCAVIITTELLGPEVRKELKPSGQKGSPFPILVEVPDKRGPRAREVDPFSELLKKAVGVEVKLK